MNKHAEKIIEIVSQEMGVPIERIKRDPKLRFLTRRDAKGYDVIFCRAFISITLHKTIGLSCIQAADELGLTHGTVLHYCFVYYGLEKDCPLVWRKQIKEAKQKVEEYIKTNIEISA